MSLTSKFKTWEMTLLMALTGPFTHKKRTLKLTNAMLTVACGLLSANIDFPQVLALKSGKYINIFVIRIFNKALYIKSYFLSGQIQSPSLTRKLFPDMFVLLAARHNAPKKGTTPYEY